MDDSEKNFNNALENQTVGVESGAGDNEPGEITGSEDPDKPRTLASGIGRRGSGPGMEEWRNRANRWFGVAGDETGATAGTEAQPGEASLARPARRSNGIGRGGVTAIAVLVVFLPLLLLLGYLLVDANNQIDSLKRSLADFNNNSTSEAAGDFLAILNDPAVQIVPFKSEDAAPVGRMVLYNAGRLRWAISYGRMDPLGSDQNYVVWLVGKASTGQTPRYDKLVSLPDVRSGGNARALAESNFPPSFSVSAYASLIVTVEPSNRVVNQPSGPRRFSLDLTQFKG